MNTRDKRRCRHLFLLMGVSLLAAAAFSTIVQTVPAAWAGEGAGALPAKAPALETHHRGEPLDVLFLLPSLPHREAFLVRLSTAPGNRQVVLCVLRGSKVTESLERSPEFPSFLRENRRLDLVGWINDRLGIPVHHIVEVKQRCWPQYPSNPHVEPNPLLELAAAFPGKLIATLPPAPNISTDLFKGSLETDPGLSFHQVLSLLGDIETARENVELSMVTFDGSGKPPDVTLGIRDGEGKPWLLQLLSNSRKPSVNAGEKDPPERFLRDCLVTFDPDNIRGKLPPAQLGQVLHRGNPALKRIALTIDDGWYADMRILDLLRGWKIKYTAFIPGGLIDEDKPRGLTQRIYESGGEICSHSYTHRVFRQVPEPVFLDELWRSESAICRVTHEVYPYVRFSGGAYDVPSVAWAAREGFWVVNWTIDSLDTSEGISANAQVDYILSNLEPGAILLFHFGGHHTYEVISRVVPEIQRRGYEVTSLSRALEGTPFRLDNDQ
jgi:peptidoglycan/xylan/chitin deacetylase (PgdA/CDA1 family)